MLCAGHCGQKHSGRAAVKIERNVEVFAAKFSYQAQSRRWRLPGYEKFVDHRVTFDDLLRERLDHDADFNVRVKSLQRIETRSH